MIAIQEQTFLVILQDIYKYEKTQASLPLLKILAVSRKSLEEGKTKPFRGVRKNAELSKMRKPGIKGSKID